MWINLKGIKQFPKISFCSDAQREFKTKFGL